MNPDIKEKAKDQRTPCGYRPGPLKANDGTRYEVRPTGQIVRLERKLGKAELKRLKKARRRQRLTENGKRQTANGSH